MTTKSEDRLLGLTLLALLATIGGELLGTPLLVAIGVTGFFLAVAALFALMTVTLVVGVGRISGPDMYDPVGAESAGLSAPRGER